MSRVARRWLNLPGGGGGSELLSGLAAAYTFESGGNLGLDSFDSNGLTNNNGAMQVPGRVGNGLGLVSASQQSLSRASNANLVLASTSWELTAWINFTDPLPTAGNYPGIVGKWGGGGEEYLIYFNGDTHRIEGAATADGSTLKVVAGTDISGQAGVWFFCDVYYDFPNTTLHMLLNNAAGDIPSIALTNTFAGTSNFVIGSTAFGAPWVNGVVDGVHLWRRLLTTTERAQVFNGGAGREHPFPGT